MNKSDVLVEICVGGKEFTLLKTTINQHEWYLKSKLKNTPASLRSPASAVYIDRDPLCFPLFVRWLRGYSLKVSEINHNRAMSPLSKLDYYETLYEDALFYGLTDFIQQLETIMQNECPLVADKYYTQFVKDPVSKEEKLKIIKEIKTLVDEIELIDERALNDFELLELKASAPSYKLQKTLSSLKEVFNKVRGRIYFKQAIVGISGALEKILTDILQTDMSGIANAINIKLTRTPDVIDSVLEDSSDGNVIRLLLTIIPTVYMFYTQRKTQIPPVMHQIPDIRELFENMDLGHLEESDSKEEL